MKKNFSGILGLILLPISLTNQAVDWAYREHFDILAGFVYLMFATAVIFFVTEGNGSETWSFIFGAFTAVISMTYLRTKQEDNSIKKIALSTEAIRKILARIEKQLKDK